jgi:hypothetical protein
MKKFLTYSFIAICFAACSSSKKTEPQLANQLLNTACNNIVAGVGGALGAAVAGNASGNGVITSNVPLSPATVGGIAAQTAAQQAQICAQNVNDIMNLFKKTQQACYAPLTQIWNNALSTGMPYTGGAIAACPQELTNFLLQFKTTMLPGGIALANTGAGQQWLQDALFALMPNMPNGGLLQPNQYGLANSVFQNGIQPFLGGGLGSIASGVVNYGPNTQVAYNPFAQTGANGIQVLPGTTTPGITTLGGTTGTSGVVNFGLTNNQVIDLRALK